MTAVRGAPAPARLIIAVGLLASGPAGARAQSCQQRTGVDSGPLFHCADNLLGPPQQRLVQDFDSCGTFADVICECKNQCVGVSDEQNVTDCTAFVFNQILGNCAVGESRFRCRFFRGDPYSINTNNIVISSHRICFSPTYRTLTPTAVPSTATPSTAAPSTATPSTTAPNTAAPSTAAPTTAAPSTVAPTTTLSITPTDSPTKSPTSTNNPTSFPTVAVPFSPTVAPTDAAGTTAATTGGSSDDTTVAVIIVAILFVAGLLAIATLVSHRRRRPRSANPLGKPSPKTSHDSAANPTYEASPRRLSSAGSNATYAVPYSNPQIPEPQYVPQGNGPRTVSLYEVPDGLVSRSTTLGADPRVNGYVSPVSIGVRPEQPLSDPHHYDFFGNGPHPPVSGAAVTEADEVSPYTSPGDITAESTAVMASV